MSLSIAMLSHGHATNNYGSASFTAMRPTSNYRRVSGSLEGVDDNPGDEPIGVLLPQISSIEKPLYCRLAAYFHSAPSLDVMQSAPS